MRSLNALYTIPAHLNNVSDVRFFRSDGTLPLHIASQASPTPDISMDSADTPDVKEESATPAPTPAPNATQDKAALTQEWQYRSGLYLASAGYDGVVKLWSADDWQLLATLQTDGSKVMSVDLSSDAKLLASGTYNRNCQLFSPESAL